MPLVHIVRVIKGQDVPRPTFIIKYFMYGITITLTVLISSSYLSAVAGLRYQLQWHIVRSLSVGSMICMLIAYTVTPHCVKLWQRLLGTAK